MSKETNRNVYVGHRYVPKIMGEWDNQTDYEGLSIVTNQGTSYTSKKRVPVGIDILNEEFWVVTGNYNAQVEQYRQDVRNTETRVNTKMDTIKNDVDDSIEEINVKFENTVKYLNDFGFNVLDYGFKGDGTAQDTELLNTLITSVSENGGGNIYFPPKNDPYMIHTETGVTMKDDIHIQLDNKAVLKLTPSNLERHEMFRCEGVNNIEFSGGQLIGERYEHNGDTGQWGMGIMLIGVNDYKIHDMKFSGFWGDGIYIGRSRPLGRFESNNGHIYNVECDDNRRQGISIVSAIDLVLDNVVCSNTSGQAPESGIDIEPNDNDDSIDRIVLNNVRTFDNASYGLILSLGGLAGSGKKANIEINNFKDTGSHLALGFIKINGDLEGETLINGFHSNDAGDKAMFFRDFSSNNYRVEINDIKIVNPFSARTTQQESERYGGIINILREEVDPGINNISNITMNNIDITDNRGMAYSDISIYDSHEKVTDLTFNNLIRLSHNAVRQNGNYNTFVYDPKELLTLESEQELVNYPTDERLIYTHVIVKGENETNRVFLNRDMFINSSLKVTNMTENLLSISINSDHSIIPSETGEKSVTTRTVGNSLTFKKIEGQTFLITDMVGKWNNLFTV